jgi:cyclic pyranopterin phosphate synthase
MFEAGRRLMARLTHFDRAGRSRMVDVSSKTATVRVARASGRLRMQAATIEQIMHREIAKGDVLEVARLAGIMAAKRTGELIPLCHNLPIDGIDIDLKASVERGVEIEATVKTAGRTGVEMEALVAVSAAALTVYDMCKSLDREIVIESIQLEEKSGGRSGHFLRAAETGQSRLVSQTGSPRSPTRSGEKR